MKSKSDSQSGPLKRVASNSLVTVASAERRGQRSRHPALVFLAVAYLSVHVAVLCVQGRQLTDAQHRSFGRALLVAHELMTVFTVCPPLHGLITGWLTDAQLADITLCMFGYTVPMFQHLMSVHNPGTFTSRKWGVFHAIVMMAGVAFKQQPTHSLVLGVTAPFAYMLLPCLGTQRRQHTCSPGIGTTLRCLIWHWWAIALIGGVTWLVTYMVARKQSVRKRAGGGTIGAVPVADITADGLPQAGPGCSTPPERAAGRRSGEEAQPDALRRALLALSRHASPKSSPKPSPKPSPAPSQRTLNISRRPHGLHDGQGVEAQQSSSPTHRQAQPTQPRKQSPLQQLGDAAQPQAAQRHEEGGGGGESGLGAASYEEEAAPLPFESFGIHLFRSLGLAPAMQGLVEVVNSLVDRVDEALVLRVVCLPIAAYSLAFALMSNINFVGYSFSSLNMETFFTFIISWFVLGRDSVAFDMTHALNEVQAQLAASLTALAKPRQQSMMQHIDSVRQQIVAGDGREGLSPAAEEDGGDDIQLLEPLGEGTFGKVFKGMWRGTVVAVKSMVLPSNAGFRRERMAIMEAAISSALSHPNVLQTYTYSLRPMKHSTVPGSIKAEGKQVAGGVQQQQQGAGATPAAQGFEVRIVLEYMDRGTLRDALDAGSLQLMGPSGQYLNFEAVLDTAADIAKGMLHLHSLNIIHSDLKARNVLLTSSATDPRGFTAKISDFGLSQKMEAEETHVSKLFQGTPSHMAPEVFLTGSQSKASDVYAFGITMWELYTARRPYKDVLAAMLPHHVAEKGVRPEFPSGAPQAYVDLAQRCWSGDVEARPSFKEVVTQLNQLQRDTRAWAELYQLKPFLIPLFASAPGSTPYNLYGLPPGHSDDASAAGVLAQVHPAQIGSLMVSSMEVPSGLILDRLFVAASGTSVAAASAAPANAANAGAAGGVKSSQLTDFLQEARSSPLRPERPQRGARATNQLLPATAEVQSSLDVRSSPLRTQITDCPPISTSGGTQVLPAGSAGGCSDATHATAGAAGEVRPSLKASEIRGAPSSAPGQQQGLSGHDTPQVPPASYAAGQGHVEASQEARGGGGHGVVHAGQDSCGPSQGGCLGSIEAWLAEDGSDRAAGQRCRNLPPPDWTRSSIWLESGGIEMAPDQELPQPQYYEVSRGAAPAQPHQGGSMDRQPTTQDHQPVVEQYYQPGAHAQQPALHTGATVVQQPAHQTEAQTMPSESDDVLRTLGAVGAAIGKGRRLSHTLGELPSGVLVGQSDLDRSECVD